MHRAAASATDAIDLAEQFGHDTTGICALGKRMTVTAMRGRHPVSRAQVSANADTGCFLTDIEMQEAGRLTLAAGDLGDAFEATQENHPLEKIKQDLAIRQVRGACQMVCPRP